jgi:hypothetical protein
MHRHHALLLMALVLANSSLAIAASSTPPGGGSGGSGHSGSGGSSSAGASHGSFGFGAHAAAQVTTGHLRSTAVHPGSMLTRPPHPTHPTHPVYLRVQSERSESTYFHQWGNFCLDDYQQGQSVDPFHCRHATKAPVNLTTGVPIG